MKLYWIDQEGWFGIEGSVIEAENLEWLDVIDDEYILIDDEGFIYEPYESDEGFYGYKWRKTSVMRPKILDVVMNYRDGDQLSLEDHRKVWGVERT